MRDPMDELRRTLITINPKDSKVRFANRRQFIKSEENRISGIAKGTAILAMTMDIEGFNGIDGIFARITPVR
jgi:hypothetical protein